MRQDEATLLDIAKVARLIVGRRLVPTRFGG